MLLPREVRKKLAALHSTDEDGDSVQYSAEQVQAETVVRGSRQMPPGREIDHSLGHYLSIRLTPAQIGDWAEQIAALAWETLLGCEGFPAQECHQLAFLDIETTGLGATPLFLVGILHIGNHGPHIHQLLARHYAEEPAVLAATRQMLDEVQVLVSFNGRSFDVPYLRDRSRYHRMEWSLELERHVDMLHVARRQRDLPVPDHRLVTLESRLCRRHREDDIPGSLIPAAYHRFVDTGESEELATIIHHNQVDLLTTMELAARWPEDSSPS